MEQGMAIRFENYEACERVEKYLTDQGWELTQIVGDNPHGEVWADYSSFRFKKPLTKAEAKKLIIDILNATDYTIDPEFWYRLQGGGSPVDIGTLRDFKK